MLSSCWDLLISWARQATLCDRDDSSSVRTCLSRAGRVTARERDWGCLYHVGHSRMRRLVQRTSPCGAVFSSRPAFPSTATDVCYYFSSSLSYFFSASRGFSQPIEGTGSRERQEKSTGTALRANESEGFPGVWGKDANKG
jgi:hypothetical protein